jgi:hypothetical protein
MSKKLEDLKAVRARVASETPKIEGGSFEIEDTKKFRLERIDEAIKEEEERE